MLGARIELTPTVMVLVTCWPPEEVALRVIVKELQGDADDTVIFFAELSQVTVTPAGALVETSSQPVALLHEYAPEVFDVPATAYIEASPEIEPICAYTVNVTVRSFVSPYDVVAVSCIVLVPVEVGVPVTAPVDVEDNESPAGSVVPDLTAHVIVPIPVAVGVMVIAVPLTMLAWEPDTERLDVIVKLMQSV